jgi:hypothetical protein
MVLVLRVRTLSAPTAEKRWVERHTREQGVRCSACGSPRLFGVFPAIEPFLSLRPDRDLRLSAGLVLPTRCLR